MIAIDIALIPPKDIIKIIEDIVKKAHIKGQAEHLMSENDFIPHISLSMGCTDEKNIKKINKEIEELVQDSNPINIELTDLEYFLSSEGKKTYWLSIKKNEDLQRLHEKIHNRIEKFLSYDPSPDMFYRKEGEDVNKVSRGIPMFKERIMEKFDPHVTLLVYETDFKDFPLKFLASRLAICHAGVRTSCRKILYETELN